MNQKNLYNKMVRFYNRSRRKLNSLTASNKNLRKQSILRRRIERLFVLLSGMQASLKTTAATAVLATGMVLFQPNAAQAQTFGAPVSNPFGLTSTPGGISAPVFVDLDADGDMDLISGDVFNSFQYYENTGTNAAPVYSAVQVNPFGLTNIPYSSKMSFADLDNDGDLDLMGGNSSGNFFYFENTGSNIAPAFTTSLTNPFGLSYVYAYSAPAFVDIDNDGDMDMFSGDLLGNFTYFENIGSNSSPSFAAAVANPFGLANIGDYLSVPTFVDLDSDGDMDMMAGQYTNSPITDNNFTYYENTGSNSAPAFAAGVDNPMGLSNIGALSSTAFADLDNDGDLDMMAGENSGAFFYFQFGPCTSAATPVVSGPNAVCQMVTATYTATSAGAISYTWGTLPSGMSFASGNNNHSNPLTVNIAAGTLSGSLSVTATNACGTTTPTTFAVSKKPAIPGPITATSLCGNNSATYSVAPVFSATSYNWSVPTGLTIVGPAHGTNITVSKSSSFIVGNIMASAVNACGFVQGTVKTVYGKAPATPAPISGATTVCTATSSNYTTAGSAGATSYTWSVSGNATVTGAGTSATVNIASNFTTGTLSVIASNPCGNSYTRTLALKGVLCQGALQSENGDLKSLEIAAEDVMNFNLYPNPTSGEFTIVMSENIQLSTNLMMEVYDVLGNKVLNSEIKNSQSSINIESFDKGMYFVRVIDANGNMLFSQRVIKQ